MGGAGAGASGLALKLRRPPRWRVGLYRVGMKAENLLAELDRLRKDVPKDDTDLEYLTLHHVFCFVSYKMTEFRAYVEAEDKKGTFKAYEAAEGGGA